MTYDFDTVIPRKHTNSLKYDFAVQRGRPADILPLWVADMDFQTPREVIDALVEKSRHGIFGYSEPDGEYFSALSDWFRTQHGWNIDPSHIVKTPGVVFALCTLIRTLTRPGEAVLIQEPVYYPFHQSVRANQRKLVVSELVYENGKYRMDFADFEQKIIDNQVKLFLLCSPHNPSGVWTRDDLRIGICVRTGFSSPPTKFIRTSLIPDTATRSSRKSPLPSKGFQPSAPRRQRPSIWQGSISPTPSSPIRSSGNSLSPNWTAPDTASPTSWDWSPARRLTATARPGWLS